MEDDNCSTLKTSDDKETLFTRKWKCPDGVETKSLVTFVHGLGEHCGRYDSWFTSFAEEGISVFAFDHRGHGKTTGTRGHTNFEFAMSDIALVMRTHQEEHPELPHFLYGHSMGGGFVLYYALNNKESKINGVIASAPAIAPANPPNIVVQKLGGFASKLLPTTALDNGLELEGLARNEETINKYKEDPLVHGRISLSLATDLLSLQTFLPEHAKEFTSPLIILHGTEDKLTSWKASEKFADDLTNCSDKTFKSLEGYYHEIHNEEEKYSTPVKETILDWIRERSTLGQAKPDISDG